jgi:uncharacterized repeat protein (TIGR01451 family)
VTRTNEYSIGRDAVRTTLSLALVAVALSIGGCCSVSAKAGAGHSGGSSGTETRTEQQPARSGAMRRPDLPADWNWSGQALPTGDLNTSLITLEHFAPARVNAQSEYQYTIRVKNISSSIPLNDVVVHEHVPAAGFVVTSTNPVGDASGETMSWKLGRLAPGDMQSIVVRGKGLAEGVSTKCASVDYTPTVCVETAVVSASLDLKKICPTEVLAGEDIPMKFVLKNPGTGDATGVKIVDQLPDGWTVNGKNEVTFDVGTLKAGETREFTAVAKASKTGSFVNRATATAAGGLKSAEAATQSIAVKKAVLDVTKTSSSKTEVLSHEATYTITVHNSGDAPAQDFVVTDTMTGADRIMGASDGGTISGNTVTWHLEALAPGATKSVKVNASRDTAGTLSDSVKVSAKGVEPLTAAAQTAFQGVSAILLELVDSPDPIAIGETTTYTITVTNQGTAPDSDIVVACAFEDAVQFVSADGVTQGVHEGKTVTFASLPSLAPKQSVKWKVVVKGVSEADTRFTVTLNTKETGRPIITNEATRVYK